MSSLAITKNLDDVDSIILLKLFAVPILVLFKIIEFINPSFFPLKHHIYPNIQINSMYPENINIGDCFISLSIIYLHIIFA